MRSGLARAAGAESGQEGTSRGRQPRGGGRQGGQLPATAVLPGRGPRQKMPACGRIADGTAAQHHGQVVRVPVEASQGVERNHAGQRTELVGELAATPRPTGRGRPAWWVRSRPEPRRGRLPTMTVVPTSMAKATATPATATPDV